MEQSKMPVRLLSDPGSSFWIRQCNNLFSPQLSFAIAIFISISIAIPLNWHRRLAPTCSWLSSCYYWFDSAIGTNWQFRCQVNMSSSSSPSSLSSSPSPSPSTGCRLAARWTWLIVRLGSNKFCTGVWVYRPTPHPSHKSKWVFKQRDWSGIRRPFPSAGCASCVCELSFNAKTAAANIFQPQWQGRRTSMVM